MTSTIEEMRRDDFNFTQESQQEAVKEIIKRPETMEQMFVGLIREILKYVEDSEEATLKFHAELIALRNKLRADFVKRNAAKSESNDTNGTINKENVGGTNDSITGEWFPTERVEKRKRGVC